MTRRQSTATLARLALTDATTLTTLIDTALTNLHLGQPGLPERTPGASPSSASGGSECRHPECSSSAPCPIHDPDGLVHLTATERHAITPDPATRDLTLLKRAVRDAARALATAATITHRWGLAGVDDTTIAAGLKERLDEIWCRTCAAAGISTVHRIGRTECSFCESFRLTGACGLKNPNNHPAPKALLDIHFRRRLDSADVTRTMTATYGPQWNRKQTKKNRKAA